MTRLRSVGPTPLAEMVAAGMDARGIGSARQLARMCGFSVDTAVSVIAGRRAPQELTLRRLADGLGLSIQALRHAAGRARGERTPFVVPPSWDGLPTAHRDLLYRMAGALLQTNDGNSVGNDAVGHVITPRGQNRFAARHDDTNGGAVNPIFSDGQ